MFSARNIDCYNGKVATIQDHIVFIKLIPAVHTLQYAGLIKTILFTSFVKFCDTD